MPLPRHLHAQTDICMRIAADTVFPLTAADFNNMRAITVIVAPPVYNALYEFAAKSKRLPLGSVWYLIALIGGVIPELIHRSLKSEDMLVA
eukprot:COSAG06_NODE_2756_length_6336_cov_29.970980_3_plen_91_part_00